MAKSKTMTTAERRARREMLKRIRECAAHASGILDQDDPLFGSSEAAYRRGFMHGICYIENFFKLPRGLREEIQRYQWLVYKWRFSLTSDCKPKYPPSPKKKKVSKPKPKSK